MTLSAQKNENKETCWIKKRNHNDNGRHPCEESQKAVKSFT